MNSSFYNGVSGAKTHQFGIDVWADNISNVNTVGFKSYTPEFSTIFSTTLTGNYFDGTTSNISYGSRSQTTGMSLKQGSFQNTDNVFDLSLGKDGWFGVQGAGGSLFYTRAGSFSIDANGNMVDANGNYLLGTVGNNYTPTTLSKEILDDFGKYYSANPKTAEVFQVSPLTDILLSGVESQTKITLPDYLYYPPTPTQNVKWKGNLDPKVVRDSVDLPLNQNDINYSININDKLVDVSGGVSNTSNALEPKQGDAVKVYVQDSNGVIKTALTYLDDDLLWQINGIDLFDLDLDNGVEVRAELYTDQEVANVEKFASSIISPSGSKDVLSMVFTKQIPQPPNGSIWDGVLEIRSFYEKFEKIDYDANVTYDPNEYIVYADLGYVEKRYDPSKYYIDRVEKAVYEIVDTKVGMLHFGGEGQLLGADIPAMNNSGVLVDIDIGAINNFDGLTSSVNLKSSRTVSQDGHVAGLLKDYGMDERGNIIAEFTNGKSVPMAKVAVYHFQNDQGLTRTTSTLFQESSNSGKPIFYTDASGNYIHGTQVFSNRLETSNVNLGTALTELIVMQKAFDASAKSITTSDELIKNVIQMKR